MPVNFVSVIDTISKKRSTFQSFRPIKEASKKLLIAEVLLSGPKETNFIFGYKNSRLGYVCLFIVAELSSIKSTKK